MGCDYAAHFFLVSEDGGLRDLLLGLWPECQGVNWSVFSRGSGAIEYLFTDPPDLLVVDNSLADFSGVELARTVKSENVYRQLPVVLCLEPRDLSLDFRQLEIDDFLIKPLEPVSARARLELSLARAARELDANPLTKLPGNTSIIHKIQDLIDRREKFAMAYVDLDHFKSFNDKYGFSRGDEILMMTARVIVNTIRSFVGIESFVGHVGGDDFVFIMPPERVETACKMIVDSFDAIVPNFYDQDDRERGSILSVDRQGRQQTFPMMAVSIAVVLNSNAKLRHFGEASQIAMNLKKEAKKNPKSCYVLDQRET
ncbi:MAG: diguanylate cyclase [Deltaproteobacteria bacterium]|nr:diguanylate cyclase [Deltaproteobacteria bacterium]